MNRHFKNKYNIYYLKQNSANFLIKFNLEIERTMGCQRVHQIMLQNESWGFHYNHVTNKFVFNSSV